MVEPAFRPASRTLYTPKPPRSSVMIVAAFLLLCFPARDPEGPLYPMHCLKDFRGLSPLEGVLQMQLLQRVLPRGDEPIALRE